MAITKHGISSENEEVFIIDVLTSVTLAMQVPVYPSTLPVTYFTIHFEPGRNGQIIDSLTRLDAASLSGEKYPLIAALMPISEKSGSGFNEVIFPRIVIANLTKTNTGTELVKDKYSSDGVFKKILRPCVREFIKQLAYSNYTNIGDPDAYEYTVREQPFEQPVSDGLNDYVDIIEILNLKVIFFSQIKNC